MSVPSILDRYVFREVTAAFLFCFAVFFVTGLIGGFLPMLQRGMEAGMALTLILFEALLGALPSTLVTVLPLSIIIGILLGLGRMSSDNEVAAIKSAGISVVRLLPPVLLLGLLGLAATLFCTLSLIPKGITHGKRLLQQAATTRIDAGIEERVFFDSLPNLIVYVDRVDSQSGVLHNVFIRESSQPDEAKTILARRGKITPDPEGKSLILDLRNGSILNENQYGENKGGLQFESYTFKFPLNKAATQTSVKSLEEMSIPEIMRRVSEAKTKLRTADSKPFQDFYRKVILLGRTLVIQRFTHPLACIALAFIAFPIGLVNLRKSRLNNVAVGLGVIFVYYALTLAVERVARSAIAPPELALPLPPVLFILLALCLTNKVRLERLDNPVRFFTSMLRRLRFGKRGGATQ